MSELECASAFGRSSVGRGTKNVQYSVGPLVNLVLARFAGDHQQVLAMTTIRLSCSTRRKVEGERMLKYTDYLGETGENKPGGGSSKKKSKKKITLVAFSLAIVSVSH